MNVSLHHSAGVILLHCESHHAVQSHSSHQFFTPSPQYSWYALHVFSHQFALLHFHSRWLSVHSIVGVLAVSPDGHSHDEVFVNHGVVCLVEKYVVHPFSVPHDADHTVVQLLEHVEALVPFLLQSSQSSSQFFSPSPHHCCFALHDGDVTFDQTTQFHV